MDKFLIKRFQVQPASSVPSPSMTQNKSNEEMSDKRKGEKGRVEWDEQDLVADPGLRLPISSHDVNDQDRIRRAYLQKGPFQPKEYDFPFINEGKKRRRFVRTWFSEFDWLEYSIEKNAAYCLFCYLFPEPNSELAFIKDGFKRFKEKQRLQDHERIHTSARMKCEALMNNKQSIVNCFAKHSEHEKRDYYIRLNASIDVIRFLLKQGLAFRGHDETDESPNRGNFLELLSFLAEHNEEIDNVVLEKAPQNCMLVASKIQRQIVSSIASEVIERIVSGIRDDVFTILVDESRDISVKEQMAIVLRYVDKDGSIIESLLGLVHVSDTSSASLFKAILQMLSKVGLSINQLRGQGYDGASNMKGEFNGLKAMILRENPSAFYIHCFAHQLQLVVIAVAKKQNDVTHLFDSISAIMTCVGGSCKRHDRLRELELDRVQKELKLGYIESGKGLNQPLGIKRAGDTRWGSNYNTLVNMIRMFSSIVNALHIISEDGEDDIKGSAERWWMKLQTFDFVFILHLMENILGKTNDLSLALQRKDQDIINALNLVKLSKKQLNKLRNEDNEWETFVTKVCLFCDTNDIEVRKMEDIYPGLIFRSKRKQEEVTNLHHYRYEIFNVIIDHVLNELNDRFNERNTELLLGVSCLDPSNEFASFNKEKLVHLARLYPHDFSANELWQLEHQLDNYIMDVRDEEAFQLKGISEIAKVLVEKGKDRSYFLVYRLIKLAMLLPVATASVERVFSAMKIIKNRLRNKLGDQFMNDCIVAYVERDIASSLPQKIIMQRFQNMLPRRQVLPKCLV